jgi:FkbM family methyltransferase
MVLCLRRSLPRLVLKADIMYGLSRIIRAISNPVPHAAAMLRVTHRFTNWAPLLTDYALRRSSLRTGEAVFRSDAANLSLAGQADLSNLWAIFGREEYPVFPDDECIMDIGANVGMFSVFAARRAPHSRITALEPVRSTFATLARNVNQSKLEDRISLINAAVASTDRRQRIYLGPSSDVASLYPNPSSADQISEWIDARGINTILHDERGPVSLLKMDCEGAEWEILEFAEAECFKKVRRLYVEYHALTSVKMCTALKHLARLGFRPYRTLYHGHGETAVVWASRDQHMYG